MKRLSKILVLAILAMLLLASSVHAIDMFLNTVNNTSDNNIVSQDNVLENSLPSNENSNTNNDSNPVSNTISSNSSEASDSVSNSVRNNSSQSQTISSTSRESEGLTVSDMIDIILIAVCVVLIFLGIAILIRCK